MEFILLKNRKSMKMKPLSTLAFAVFFASLSPKALANDDFNTFRLAVQDFIAQKGLKKTQPKTLPDDNMKFSTELQNRLDEQLNYKSPNADGDQAPADPLIALQVTARQDQGNTLFNILQTRKVLIQARFADDLFILLPRSKIIRLQDIPEIKSIGLQNLLQPDQVNLKRNTASEPGHSLPVSSSLAADGKSKAGSGIKVGIIDFGYANYPALLKQQLVPVPTEFKSFHQGTPRDSLSSSQNSSPHGSACTETIFRIAPAATYYLVQVGDGFGQSTDGDMLQAIDWLVSKKVNVINFSGSSQSAAHDGNAPIDNKIADITRHNILWVNAAGNDASQHWMAPIQDSNGDSLLDNPQEQVDVIFIHAPKTGFSVRLNWDDWASPTQPEQGVDINAILLGKNSNGNIVPVMHAHQSRAPHTAATKHIKTSLPVGYYALGLQSNLLTSKNVHVYIRGAEILNPVANGSIGIPATATQALSVGAWNKQQQAVTIYSGQGLTDDGRLKPEVSAPTDLPSVSMNGQPFSGTSAAAAYVSGVAALIWSQHPDWTYAQVKDYIIRNISPVSNPPTPNTQTGYGLVSLDYFSLPVYGAPPS